MKKLFVNKEACIGCGSCVAIDPEHFDFDDDGLSEVVSNENVESIKAKDATESCPTKAIKLVESTCDQEEEKEQCDGTCPNCSLNCEGC